jgi:hypothetical protein
MPYDWGPHYIVPSEVFESYSGIVQLRETFDENLLHKELEELGLSGRIIGVTNPWYYRKKNTASWIKVGESEDRHENFAVRWDTRHLENGQYEVMGMMHVFVREDDAKNAIARQNVMEITVEN